MLKVGITGGIGSGKTTVCQIFETLGIPVYYADDRAKAIMVENEQVIRQIKTLFGAEAYLPDGSLNRAHIANIAFNDQEKLSQLNAIVHPAVFADGDQWHQQQTNVPYTLKEAALLFESGSYQQMDKMITVFAPEELRIQRVVKRDATSEEQVRQRIAKQMSDEEKMKLADYVIHNDGQQALLPQVLQLHQKLKALVDGQ